MFSIKVYIRLENRNRNYNMGCGESKQNAGALDPRGVPLHASLHPYPQHWYQCHQWYSAYHALVSLVSLAHWHHWQYSLVSWVSQKRSSLGIYEEETRELVETMQRAKFVDIGLMAVQEQCWMMNQCLTEAVKSELSLIDHDLREPVAFGVEYPRCNVIKSQGKLLEDYQHVLHVDPSLVEEVHQREVRSWRSYEFGFVWFYYKLCQRSFRQRNKIQRYTPRM